MKEISMYQVDAFAEKLFSGNPAAVCVLEEWLPDELLQAIGNENNLAETAFIVPRGEVFEIRWFTPTVEVNLCGHATLAAGFVLFNLLGYEKEVINFYSPRSGLLMVTRTEDVLFLDFPVDAVEELSTGYEVVESCIGVKPVELYRGKADFLAVVQSEEAVRDLQPDFARIAKLHARGLIVTAKGEEVDFVLRFFAPQLGVNEDPVTGSVHTLLIPLWSRKLGKEKLVARQLSKRGGQILCEARGERCLIGGKARLYLTGKITIE
ncbi:MAG: PhzF family phenazine biosynthesis protein [Candidatus Atribacteria bacterium]|nr:PhzF family phenazine biosynthesis protein [Candidatus Atribacteria bacterium]